MPVYEYQCTNCQHSFEIVQSIKDSPKKKCPNCKLYKLGRLLSPSLGFCKKKEGDMKTIGELGKHRRDHMSKWEKEAADKKYEDSSRLAKNRLEQEKNGDAWYWNGVDKKKKMKEIANMDNKATRKYVENG